MKDISGQRFGRLVAEKFLYYDEKYRDHWLFHCDCGRVKEMAAANVKWGRVRSCGCMAKEHAKSLKTEDIQGKKFGQLTAVRPTDQRDGSGSIVWECYCDCGNIAFYSVNRLTQAKVKSCGCLYRKTRKECCSHRKDMIEKTNLSMLVSAKNVRKDNSSGCTGVYKNNRSGKWYVTISFQKKRYYIGTYAEREHAIIMRKKAEEYLHDPVIRNQWSNLTEHSKEKFLQYIRSSENYNDTKKE